MKSVVLTSGGMDSAVLLAIALEESSKVLPLLFNYGQRHQKENEFAKAQVEYWKRIKGESILEPIVLNVDLRQIGGSALTSETAVPRGTEQFMKEAAREIPITYVPARNTIFLSLALGVAEVQKADAIWHGANVVDYSGYPDCRPEYFKALQKAFNLATKMTVSTETGGEGKFLEIRTPLVLVSKRQIVERGQMLKVPWHLTWSCYEGREKACGTCPSCVLRIKGFQEANVIDPCPYEIAVEWPAVKT